MDWILDLVDIWLRHWRVLKSKPYVRYAVALATAAGVVLSANLAVTIFQYYTQAQSGSTCSNEAPWWVNTILGVGLIALSLFLFLHGYVRDDDRNKPSLPPTEGWIAFSIPKGWTFEQTAEVIGRNSKRNVVLQGFGRAELSAPLKPMHLVAPSVRFALKELRSLAVERTIGRYSISERGQTTYVKRR